MDEDGPIGPRAVLGDVDQGGAPQPGVGRYGQRSGVVRAEEAGEGVQRRPASRHIVVHVGDEALAAGIEIDGAEQGEDLRLRLVETGGVGHQRERGRLGQRGPPRLWLLYSVGE